MNELNANYNAFVNFARAQMAAGNEKAVARLGEQGSFTLGAGRVITAAKAGDANYDAAYKAFRSAAAKDANMAVRDLFMKSMVGIFGSESRIPDSVKAQMTNFGTSKPLTARRIMAINNAVQSLRFQAHTDLARAAEKGLNDALAGFKRTAPKDFIANAKTVVAQAIKDIATAREKFFAGEISEGLFLDEISKATGKCRALVTDSALKEIKARDSNLADAIRAACFDSLDDTKTKLGELNANLCRRLAEPAMEKLRNLPAKENLPADWELACQKQINKGNWHAGERIARMVAELAANPKAFCPTPEQSARIRAFAPSETVALRLEKALSDQTFYELVDDSNAKNVIDEKIAAFESSEDLQSLLTISFDSKLSKKEIEDELANLIKSSFQECNALKSGMRSFNEDGLHTQCMREAEGGGSCPVNGIEVPDRPQQLSSYNQAGYGSLKGRALAYAEIILNRFDEQHIGMRKMVTLLTGMADGVHGIIGDAFNLKPGKLVDESKTRPMIIAKTGAIVQDGQKDLNSYAISIADNGDVTVKVVKVERNELCLVGGLKCGMKMDGRAPAISVSRFEVTVTIPNQTDAELNGGMPKFTVTDFKQEQL